MQFAIATLLSLLSLWFAVPASLALPEPGSLRHNHDARELRLVKRAPVEANVIIDEVIGRTCPSESCPEGSRKKRDDPVICDCFTMDSNPSPDGTTTSTTLWALEFSATTSSDDNANSTTGIDGSASGIAAAKDQIWFPYSALKFTQGSLSACSP